MWIVDSRFLNEQITPSGEYLTIQILNLKNVVQARPFFEPSGSSLVGSAHEQLQFLCRSFCIRCMGLFPYISLQIIDLNKQLPSCSSGEENQSSNSSEQNWFQNRAIFISKWFLVILGLVVCTQTGLGLDCIFGTSIPKFQTKAKQNLINSLKALCNFNNYDIFLRILYL